MLDVGFLHAGADDSRPLHGLWSLWDMVHNFSLSSAEQLMTEISIMIRVAAHNREQFAAHGEDALIDSEGHKEAVRQSVETIELIMKLTGTMREFVKSGHIDFALDRLKEWAEHDKKSWDQLFNRTCAVREALKIEWRDHLFYAYPRALGDKLKVWEKEWAKTLTAFPDAMPDIFCATDCYALGHNTASVFHSMRVAEIGLRALAKERRISLPKNKPIEWATWQEILKRLDDEIQKIGQTWPAGKRKDAALEFYSGARADLNGFKDEFRNLVMHVRAQYDEFQAARALTRVHEFMARLAEKLDHRHRRINWGRS